MRSDPSYLATFSATESEIIVPVFDGATRRAAHHPRQADPSIAGRRTPPVAHVTQDKVFRRRDRRLARRALLRRDSEEMAVVVALRVLRRAPPSPARFGASKRPKWLNQIVTP